MNPLSWAALWAGLVPPLAIAALVWGASVLRRDASLIDRFWPLLVLSATIPAAHDIASIDGVPGPVLAIGVIALVWGLRLGLHLTIRNWGHGEDRRYRQMRAGHGSAFWWKSAFIVYLLQSVLAWLVALPLIVAIGSSGIGYGAGRVAGAVAACGLAIAIFGLLFEAVADAQMARFRRSRRGASDGAVMDRGLWRLSRHPNYFGEACVWWGIAIAVIALVVGDDALGPVDALIAAGLAAVSPLLMTGLLLRVSGVALTERDIADRRPDYRRYQADTPTFFPRWRRRSTTRTAP